MAQKSDDSTTSYRVGIVTAGSKVTFVFLNPQQDLDLTKLPGEMPALKDVKLLNYDEAGWTQKRAESLQKIQDIVRSTR